MERPESYLSSVVVVVAAAIIRSRFLFMAYILAVFI
jgi:hypothetical protein